MRLRDVIWVRYILEPAGCPYLENLSYRTEERQYWRHAIRNGWYTDWTQVSAWIAWKQSLGATRSVLAVLLCKHPCLHNRKKPASDLIVLQDMQSLKLTRVQPRTAVELKPLQWSLLRHRYTLVQRTHVTLTWTLDAAAAVEGSHNHASAPRAAVSSREEEWQLVGHHDQEDMVQDAWLSGWIGFEAAAVSGC